MIKIMPCRFQQWRGLFSMLAVEQCSETGLFTHLSDHVFSIPKFWKYISSESHLFFSKCSKIDIDFRNGVEKSEKCFCFQVIAFELVAVDSHYYEENNCHQHAMCYKRVLRFQISLRKRFLNSISVV